MGWDGAYMVVNKAGESDIYGGFEIQSNHGIFRFERQHGQFKLWKQSVPNSAGYQVIFPERGGLVAYSGDVAVLTGEIWHGGVLPLPHGFVESQCRFFVSMKHSNPNGQGWDWNENAGGRHYRTQCYTSGRTVTCQTFVNEGIWGHGASPLTIDGIANYLVIGVK